MHLVSAAIQRVAHDESGSMLVTVAVALPLLIAFAIFVIEVANAFEHRRHLQLQADAGALAAGQEFSRCFTDPDGANTSINQIATDYAGEVHNAQIGPTDAQSRVQTVLNSDDHAGPTGALGEPCDTGFIDVKLTEEDGPSIFAAIGLHDYHAHARVRVLRLESSDRLLPIAAEDPVPRWAEAIFVDESTGDVLARTELNPNGYSGDLAIWDNSGAPVAVPITAEHVGVRIALSGKPEGGNCGEPLIVCYDAGAANQGLAHIRGWSSESSATAGSPPIARSVSLYSISCAEPYFSATGCTFGVRAAASFSVAPSSSRLTARVDGTDYQLAYDPGSGTWSTGTSSPQGRAPGRWTWSSSGSRRAEPSAGRPAGRTTATSARGRSGPFSGPSGRFLRAPAPSRRSG